MADPVPRGLLGATHNAALVAPDYLTQITATTTSGKTGVDVNIIGGGTGGGNMNLTGINGVAPSVGSGTQNSGTLRVILASDQDPVPVSFPGGVAVTQSTSPWVVSGSVSITGSVAVTGTFFQATQPISAASLPLPAGASTSALQTTGNASLSSIDSKLTNPLPVSGTVAFSNTTIAVTQSTAANLNATVVFASPQHVIIDSSSSIAVTQSTSPWIVKRNNDVVTGSLTTAGQTLVLNTDGIAAVGLGVSGTWIGVIYFEATVDGIDWVPAYFATISGGSRENNTEVNDQYLANVAGASQVRFRVGAMDSGTVNITILANPSLSVVRAINDTAQELQATVSQSNAANLKATIVGTGTFAAQVTGTVTANAGTNLNTSALNLETTQSAISAKLPATLGQKTSANSLAVVVASDQGAIPISGSISFTAPQHVIVDSGTLTSVTSITNAVTVAQATAANLNATVVGTGTFAAQVTGTVTANAGTNLNTSLLALDTSVNGILLAQASTTSGQLGPLVQGAVTTSAPSYTTAKTSPLSLTTAGALRVDGSGVTQPISGSISFTSPQHVIVDSGTLTAVTSITNAVTVAQATAANLNATVVGTGTFAAQVTGTVTANAGTNLNTSLLALDTSVNGILLAQGSTTSGQTGPLIQTATTTNAPTYTTAKTNPLSTDTSGLLRVSLKDTPANTNKFLVTADAITFASPQHVIVDSGTVTANAGTNLNTSLLALESTQVKLTISQGAVLDSNTQVMVGGSVTTAAPAYTTGQISPLSLTTAGALRIDGSGVTQPVSGSISFTAPQHVIVDSGTITTVSTVTAVTSITNALPAGTNNIGQTTPAASATAGGVSQSKTDALVATAVAVKASAGQVYGYHISNLSNADAYVHFYNIASGSVTVGTSARTRTLYVAQGGVVDTSFAYGLTFSTAITIAATTTITGNTAPSTGLLIDVDYV